jgi:hypothetical protein
MVWSVCQKLETGAAASGRRAEAVGLRQREPLLHVVEVAPVAADEAEGGETADGQAAQEADHVVALGWGRFNESVSAFIMTFNILCY